MLRSHLPKHTFEGWHQRFIFAKTSILEIVHPLAADYAARFSSSEAELLASISAKAHADHAQPHMLSGHLQGILLEMIAGMIRPKSILEIGTMLGYSTICLAKGLDEHGCVHTIEMRDADADIAEMHFNKAGLQHMIKLHRGNAIEIIPQLNEVWDLVFLDADKVNYIAYYEMVMPRLVKGGYLLADNVLFHGAVLEDDVKGKNATAIHAFNLHVRNDPSVTVLMLPFRDGLTLIRKN